jgi:hypothetical protein
MTHLRYSTFLVLAMAAIGCAPPAPEDGTNASNVTNSPGDTMPTSDSHMGVRPQGSLVWNQALEGKGSTTGTTPVLHALLLRADGTMAAWISNAVDGTDHFDTQLFDGTYAFDKRLKDADDMAPFAYPVDDRYEDVVNGVKDDGDAYLLVLTFASGDRQSYAYYLETDGTWHMRNVATNTWMGLNPPTNNNVNVTYCETSADCMSGTCPAAAPDAFPVLPSSCM